MTQNKQVLIITHTLNQSVAVMVFGTDSLQSSLQGSFLFGVKPCPIWAVVMMSDPATSGKQAAKGGKRSGDGKQSPIPNVLRDLVCMPVTIMTRCASNPYFFFVCFFVFKYSHRSGANSVHSFCPHAPLSFGYWTQVAAGCGSSHLYGEDLTWS